MLKLKGILRKEDSKHYIRKDGTEADLKIFYIEPEGSMYPIKVTSTSDIKIGKIGNLVDIDVRIYPYYFSEGKRKRAFIDFYIPQK